MKTEHDLKNIVDLFKQVEKTLKEIDKEYWKASEYIWSQDHIDVEKDDFEFGLEMEMERVTQTYQNELLKSGIKIEYDYNGYSEEIFLYSVEYNGERCTADDVYPENF